MYEHPEFRFATPLPTVDKMNEHQPIPKLQNIFIDREYAYKVALETDFAFKYLTLVLFANLNGICFETICVSLNP